MAQFHPLAIAEVRRETADAVSVALEVPSALKDAFRFEPGQYLTLRADIGGRSVRRPYSICAGLDEPRLRVGIKAVAEGRFSTYAQTLRPGQTLDVLPPQGRFRWLSPAERPVSAGPAHHLAFAAGSGITPILSIAKSVLRRRPADTFTLCYGNRGQGSVMFLDELHDLKDSALGRLRIHHVFSREPTDGPLTAGRLDGARVRALAGGGYFDPTSIDAAYVCGPGEMHAEVSTALASLGLPADRVRTERFTPAPPVGPARPPPLAPSSPAAAAEVRAIVDGLTRTVRIQGEETILAAAERQGVSLPYSCAGGMCCTCRCKVLEGSVRMDVCYSLEGWELDAGFVLACQSHPATERVVLDFDAR